MKISSVTGIMLSSQRLPLKTATIISLLFLGLVGLMLLLVLCNVGGMGAGDVKLMAAIGVWLGPRMTLVSFGVGAMIGGVVAVIDHRSGEPVGPVYFIGRHSSVYAGVMGGA